MSHPERSWGKALADFFASLRLTIALLIILSITSIFGTVIPQGDVPHEYLHGISQTKLKLYQSLDLFDMYHSWWFIGILILFTINLTVCSARRLPHVWRFISSPAKVLDQALFDSLSQRLVIPRSGGRSRLDSLQKLLGQRFGTVTVTETDGAVHLFSECNSLSRLAVYVTHLSIIIIFVGSIIGSMFGYKGFVTISEGEAVSTVQTRSGKTVDLGFLLRCEDFSVTHYPSGAPKEFKSIITVLENGRPVPDYTNVRVIVNDPLTYKGITFYQSSYGNAGEYFFTASDLSGKDGVTFQVDRNSSVTLPDGSSMHIIEETDDVSKFVPNLTGPAVQVEIHDPRGGSEKVIVYANHPELNIQHAKEHNGGLVLQYKGAQKRMYTGLQVAKDPGVWVVWLGCLLMVVGIYAAFFMSHRRIWVRVVNGAVTIGGNASKNQGGFQLFMEQLVTKLKKQLPLEDN